MRKHMYLVFATLALSTVAFAQQDGLYQIGYAANLNIGDSVVHLSNNGAQGGFYPNTLGGGNICVNVYTFDPAEEEISCCACLVTPDGINSLSVKNDLINNSLTPAIPTSVVIKLVGTLPTADPVTGTFTVCDPTVALRRHRRSDSFGMLAWGTTLEPAANIGTYGVVNVPFINGDAFDSDGSELTDLATVCGFIHSNGTGFGICGSCSPGALSGTKQ